MSYTAEEQAAAVEQLVRPRVRYEYDDLGVRRVGTSFSDLRDAAAGVFLSRDEAPFYVCRLARDRLLVAVQALQDRISEMNRLAVAAGRQVTPVTKTTSLNNARSALSALAAATAQRTGVYQDITQVPAFQRFNRSTNKFLVDEGRKLVSGGDIIEGPEEAQRLLRPKARELRVAWDELVEGVDTLRTSIESFQALDLPATVSASVMENAQAVLSSRIQNLELLTAEERLGVLRDAVLDVLSIRAAVSGFASLNGPTTFVVLEGSGSLFADEGHPATTAGLQSIVGGYEIYEAQRTLEFTVDGLYNISYSVPGSFIGRIDFIGDWPRTTTIGTAVFNILVGATQLPIIVNPSTYTALQFQDLVNTSLGVNTSTVGAIIDFTTPRVVTEATFMAGAPDTFTSTGGEDYGAAGVVPGDLLTVNQRGQDGYLATYTVDSISGGVLEVTLETGTSPANGADVIASIGALEGAFPAITLTDAATALATRLTLRLEDAGGSGGTLAELGVVSGIEATTQRSGAQLVADDVNTSPSTFVGGSPRLSATVSLIPEDRLSQTSIRTHPEDPTKLTIYQYRGEGVLDSMVGPTFTSTLQSSPPSTIQAGDAVIIREADEEADINTSGAVISISGDQVEVEMVGGVTSGVGSTVLLEIGVDISDYRTARTELSVVVDEATVARGTYNVVDPPPGGLLPLEVFIDSVVPGYVQPGFQPFFLTGDVSRRAVTFQSRSTGLESALNETGGTARNDFFTEDPAEAVGATSWVLLPDVPARLEAGDVLELHLTNAVTPTLTRTIELIEPENNLIQLTEPIASNLVSSINFSQNSPPPFARIRKTVKNNFDEMSGELTTWRNLGVNNTLKTFRDLDAAINPVLANKNPSSAQVGAVRNHLTTLSQALTVLTTPLEAYTADVVDEVETLIKAYRGQGSDRAVDVLLSADFQEFFALDADASSYSGNVQKASRNVQVEDLPIFREGRQSAADAYDDISIGAYEDVNTEFTVEELDTSDDVDIPEFNDNFPTLIAP